MAPPSLDPSADPTLDLTRSARLRAPLRTQRSPTRTDRPSSAPPETAAEQPGAAPAESPSPAPAKGSRQPKSARPVPKLVLDLQAVADVDGLEQEVAVLRASIRQLAQDGDMAAHVKVLAELRHQIEALCRALKTRQSLVGADGDERAAAMERALDELDRLGVER